MTVDAIIPALNEERTVGSVVRAVLASSAVRGVIVVDDGSTDRTTAVAEEAGARVLRHATRQGKGATLATGVAASDADAFLFLDADLFRLTPAHVAQIVGPVAAGERAMVIGLRDHGMLEGLVAHLPLVSGQRAMRREVFTAVPPALLRGYGAEISFNAACRYRKFPYGVVRLKDLAVRRKFDKVGLRRALWQYTRMWLQVASAMVRARLAHARGNF